MLIQKQMLCCGCRELNGLSGIIDSEHGLTPRGCAEFLLRVKNDLHEDEYQERYMNLYGELVIGKVHEAVDHTPAFFIFTQAGTEDDEVNDDVGAYGDVFKEFIEDQKLGTVMVTEAAVNENSDNLVKVYVWTVDQDTYKAWKGAY